MTTGIRLAELVGLNASSITGEAGAWQLDVRGKGNRHRTVPLLDALTPRLNTYERERTRAVQIRSGLEGSGEWVGWFRELVSSEEVDVFVLRGRQRGI